MASKKEEMNLALYDFVRTLDKSHMEKALKLKEDMEEKGYAPEHFRVSANSLWSKGIK